jgi:mono/diheme cytochrome c family protein
LLPSLASFQAGEESSIYLARLLAEIGDANAMGLLVNVLQEHGKQQLVREAAFAGLRDREAVFIGVNNARYRDKDFNKWLDDAIHKDLRKVEPPKITGDHLASYQRGEKLYVTGAACFGCHGADGGGLPNLGPPLDESDWVNGDTNRLIRVLLHGLQGPITVSGELYTPPAAMPGLGANPTITDKDLADIVTYIRHAWSNRSPLVEEATVEEIRAATKEREGALYTEADFK